MATEKTPARPADERFAFHRIDNRLKAAVMDVELAATIAADTQLSDDMVAMLNDLGRHVAAARAAVDKIYAGADEAIVLRRVREVRSGC